MTGASVFSPSFPRHLNLGSGKDWREDFLNLDVDDTWAPDAVCDLSAVKDLAAGVPLTTHRFGKIALQKGCFDTIIANDVLEHVPDLMAMMTTCLNLLSVGGVFKISVPYDLSFGAWQDPTHVRAFNERSWLYYTDWFWYMGWSETRFALDSFEFVPSPLGNELKAADVPREQIIRTPRAIDSMSVTLRKIELTPNDRTTWEHWRERRRQAQERKRHCASPASASPVAETDMGPAIVRPSYAGDDPLKAFAGDLASERDRYCVWTVTPEGYTHQHAYDDVAMGLSEAFAEIGGSAPMIRDPTEAKGRTLIVLGPQLLPSNASSLLPKDSVLFNLEQVQHDSPWMTGPYMNLLQGRPVVDYSVRNHRALVAAGIAHARLLPIGYASGLNRILHAADKDIDVLFYGSYNERRTQLLADLESRGAKVLNLFDVYGADRDAAIGRAKIVLNVHFFEAAIFEAVRVSFLLANGVCVVTEGDEQDPDIAPFIGGLAVGHYDTLADRCMSLLADPAARLSLARAGQKAVQMRRQSALLVSLLAA